MSFLQLGFLLALPLALLPVIIHLLNRLRYRTVKWAGMMFLLAASRSSTRRSKLRHWLILAARCLLLAAFLVALARPMVGGWLGSSLSGKPEVVALLLDRSASMETLDPRHQLTRRAHALALFAGGASQLGAGPRYVLIDSATLQPQEIGDPAALPGLSAASGTDTGADAAALIQAGIDYLTRNPSGRAELWLASDLQASNWRADSPRWSRLGAALAALPGDNRLRVLDLSGGTAENLTLQARGATRSVVSGQETLTLSLRVRQPGTEPRTLPVTIEVDGARTRADLALTGQETRLQHRLTLPRDAKGGWGRVILPADANARDNEAWFAYGPAPVTPARVVVADEAAARLIRLAVAPDARLRTAQVTVESALEREPLDDTALVVWQPGLGADAAGRKLEAFAAAGGAVLVLPPALPSAPAALGLSWKPQEDAPADRPFGLGFFEEDDGPLAKTGNGVSLPVAAVTAQRRRVPVPAGADAGDTPRWSPLASFQDQQPFVLRRTSGRGTLVALASLPVPDWSSLGDGRVLVPLVQRLLAEGGRRLAAARQDVLGEWTAAAGEDWRAEGAGDEPRDPSRHAGAYRAGERRVALNRPDAEDEPASLETSRVPALFGDFRNVTVASDLAGRTGRAEQGEVWRPLVVAALLFLLVESILLAGLVPARRPAPAPAAVTDRREAA